MRHSQRLLGRRVRVCSWPEARSPGALLQEPLGEIRNNRASNCHVPFPFPGFISLRREWQSSWWVFCKPQPSLGERALVEQLLEDGAMLYWAPTSNPLPISSNKKVTSLGHHSANSKCDCLPLLDSRHLIKIGIQDVENILFFHLVASQEIRSPFLLLFYTTFSLKKRKKLGKECFSMKIKTYKRLDPAS